MRSSLRASFIALALTVGCCLPADAQRQMEKLGRGVVAMRKNSPSSQVYVSWRLLGNDPEGIAFNVYRAAQAGKPEKLNATPLTETTDFTDTPPRLRAVAYTYVVQPVLDGVEVPDAWAMPGSSRASLPADPSRRQFVPVKIQPTPDGPIKVGFCWVGDLDGDGEYDFVIVRTQKRQFLEAYKRDGTFLWRMDMGPNSTNHYNIEPGSSTLGVGHGDNATVYDMDGDGKAEVIVRTARGVVFGDGKEVTAADDNTQFLSIVDGLTGAEGARAPVPNPYLSDGPLQGHMGILYLDGKRPSVILSAKNRRGSGGFQGLATAWDYREGKVTRRWSYDAHKLGEYAPEGHQIRVGDPDNDGKDEMIDIGYAIDDDGRQLFNVPEVVHGDRFHMADIDPDRPGPETYLIQQNNPTGLVTALIESHTGKTIKKWYAGAVIDVGRGLAADIDPDHFGYELFSTQSGIYDRRGSPIPRYAKADVFPPEAVWWDGNLSREFLTTVGQGADSPAIDRFNPESGASGRVQSFYNDAGGSYWLHGGRPPFWGDILGDWREEVIVVARDNSELRIYTTVSPAKQRLYTLMHNPQYRIQVTTKGYVQAGYVDYYLGDDLPPPPPPPMVDAKLVWKGGADSSTWDAGTTPSWRKAGANSSFVRGDTVLFDISGDATTDVTLGGRLEPGAVTVYSPNAYTFAGAGTLAGPMTLTKAGAGTLTLSGTHAFTGRTTVWDGALVVNGELTQSPVSAWGGTWGGPLAAGKTGGRIGGTGRFGQTVAIKYRGTITPGAGMGSPGTLTFGGGLSAENGATLALDLSDDPGGTSRPSDRIVVTGDLSLSGKVSIIIHPLQEKLSPGRYTLATFTGKLTGGLENLVVIPPAGTPYTLSAGSGEITLTVPATRDAASITWRGGGVWDVAKSQGWLRSGTPDVFVAGDTVTFDAAGAANPTVTLSAALPVARLTVDGPGDYTFTGPGSISGTGGLTKAGSGTLTIATTNDYTGPTTITGGVLAVSELGDAGRPGSLGAAGAVASNLVLDGGTLRLGGSQTNTNRNLTLGAAGGTLDVADAGSSLQISGEIGGGGGLVKEGPGTLLLAGGSTYAGGTVIKAGTIYLAGKVPNEKGLGSGRVTLAGGALAMADTGAYEHPTWDLVVPSGSSGRLYAGGHCIIQGSLTGAGTFSFVTPFNRTDLRGDWSAFRGRIEVDRRSDFRIANKYGFGNAALHLTDEVVASFNIREPATLDIGELSGAETSSLQGGPVSGRTVTWRIGAKDTDSTFAGAIRNGKGPSALAKVGTGTLTLAGSNTYTGPTTVAAGTLIVDGSLGGSDVTVQANAGLGGSGAITGKVAFADGSRLVPSLAGSPLAIKGDVTADGTITVTGEVPAPGTYPILTYTGTITGTPTFVWGGADATATFSPPEDGMVSATFVSTQVVAGGDPGPAGSTPTPAGAPSDAGPRTEDGSNLGWILAGGALAVGCAVVVALVLFRRRQHGRKPTRRKPSVPLREPDTRTESPARPDARKTVLCPGCKAKLKVPEGLTKSQIRCPTCRTQITLR